MLTSDFGFLFCACVHAGVRIGGEILVCVCVCLCVYVCMCFCVCVLARACGGREICVCTCVHMRVCMGMCCGGETP